MSCPFKHVFGKPGEGIHSYRVFDIAIVDTVMTIIGAYFLAKYFKWDVKVTILWAFIIGEILHIIFCVDTTIVKLLKKIDNFFG